MVDMGMSENHRIEFAGRHRKVGPVPLAQLTLILVQTAIDENAGFAGRDQKAATGYRPRSL